jgi:hypothetical protein
VLLVPVLAVICEVVTDRKTATAELGEIGAQMGVAE